MDLGRLTRVVIEMLALLRVATFSHLSHLLDDNCQAGVLLFEQADAVVMPPTATTTHSWSDLIVSGLGDLGDLQDGGSVRPGSVVTLSFSDTSSSNVRQYAVMSDAGRLRLPTPSTYGGACSAYSLAYSTTTDFTWVAPSSAGVAKIVVATAASSAGPLKRATITLSVAAPPVAPPTSPPPLPPSPPLPFLWSFDPGMEHAVVTMGRYPGLPLSGPYAFFVGGTIVVQAKDNALHIHGFVTGLPPNSAGGWHVHEGFRCDDDNAVKNHYYDTDDERGDPWSPVEYVSDAEGTAEISLSMPGFSLKEAMPAMGRAIVFHNSITTAPTMRIGCGLILPSRATVAQLGSYPGHPEYELGSGEEVQSVRGLLTVDKAVEGIRITGTLVGLESSVSGGWHVHSGYSCDKYAGVFGHYWGEGDDPWNGVTYSSDDNGVFQVDLTMANFSLSETDLLPVFGRTGARPAEQSAVPAGACF